MSTFTSRQQTHPAGSDAASVLAARVLLATRSELPTDLAGLMRVHDERSGVVTVGRAGGKLSTQIVDACGVSVVVHDPARYEDYVASAEQPMGLGDDDAMTLVPAPSLAEFVTGASPRLAAVFSPTGAIREGDVAALAAAVAACNGVESTRLVCTLPVASAWLAEGCRDVLVAAIRQSTHPVALVVIGQFDPFEDRAIMDGLVDVFEHAGSRVFLHRTDMIAVHAVAHGALGAAVGTSASLRHTIAVGQFAGRRKKKAPPGLPVFVPGINSFVDVTTLEEWYVDAPPDCSISACTRHALTDFTERDRPDLARHNGAGVLAVAASLLGTDPRYWSAWLASYWLAVGNAYELLRTETGRRDIRPYGAAKHLIVT